MELKFAKKVFEGSYFVEAERKKIHREYEIIFADKSIGKLIYFEKESSLIVGANKWMIINKKRGFFQRNRISIIDALSKKQIGSYKLSVWIIFRGYIHKMIIGENIYTFRRIPADIKFSLLDRTTHNHYKFIFYNNTDEVTYSFRINFPTFSLGNPGPDISFDGFINTSSKDFFLLQQDFI